MKTKDIRVYFILSLSCLIIFAGVFCCCFKNAHADMAFKSEHHCCPKEQGENPSETKKECPCHLSYNFIFVKNFELLELCYEFSAPFVEGAPLLDSSPAKEFIFSSENSAFDGGPPIYILNSVYRL